jgi:hypothetical protein
MKYDFLFFKGPESERSVDHLVIYGDEFYIQDATKNEFIRKCTPECSPFTNIRIKVCANWVKYSIILV